MKRRPCSPQLEKTHTKQKSPSPDKKKKKTTLWAGKAMNNLKPDLRGQEEIWLTGMFEETEQDHSEIAV